MSYLPCLDEDWVIESIPDENYLYCRVSDNHVINGELISAALRRFIFIQQNQNAGIQLTRTQTLTGDIIFQQDIK